MLSRSDSWTSCVQSLHRNVAGRSEEMAPSGVAKASALAERAMLIGVQVVATIGPEPGMGDYDKAFELVVGKELGKFAFSEFTRAKCKINAGELPSGLVVTPEFVAAKLENPNRAPDDLILIATTCEYLLAEAMELANNVRQENVQEAITEEHFTIAIEGDEELNRLFGAAPGGEAPPACRLLRQDVDLDDYCGGFGPVGYLRWQTIDAAGEIVDTDSFPLERWTCGHYPPSTDHSRCTSDRVNNMVTFANALTTLARTVRCESSDFDSEFQLFTAYSHETDPIPREKDALAKHLALRLKLDPQFASVLSLPTMEGYENRLLSPYFCDPMGGEDRFSDMLSKLENLFFFRGGDDGGDKGVNTYPVVFGGFLPSGDIAGVFAIRCDT